MATVYIPAPTEDTGHAQRNTGIYRAPDTGGASAAPVSQTTAHPITG